MMKEFNNKTQKMDKNMDQLTTERKWNEYRVIEKVFGIQYYILLIFH